MNKHVERFSVQVLLYALKIKDLVDKIAKKIGWNGQVNWNTKPKRDGEILGVKL